MQNSTQGETVPANYRKEVVAKFVEDISEGRVSLNVNYKELRQQDVELVSDVSGKLIRHLNDYVSGAKAGEEFEFLEKELFFCISVLRTYGSFKTTLSESKAEEELRRLESKIDAMSSSLGQILPKLQESSRDISKKSKSRKTRRSK